jgi:hypothetical protein
MENKMVAKVRIRKMSEHRRAVLMRIMEQAYSHEEYVQLLCFIGEFPYRILSPIRYARLHCFEIVTWCSKKSDRMQKLLNYIFRTRQDRDDIRSFRIALLEDGAITMAN